MSRWRLRSRDTQRRAGRVIWAPQDRLMCRLARWPVILGDVSGGRWRCSALLEGSRGFLHIPPNEHHAPATPGRRWEAFGVERASRWREQVAQAGGGRQHAEGGGRHSPWATVTSGLTRRASPPSQSVGACPRALGDAQGGSRSPESNAPERRSRGGGCARRMRAWWTSPNNRYACCDIPARPPASQNPVILEICRRMGHAPVRRNQPSG